MYRWSGLEFTKMHSNGNDFVLVDEYTKSIIEEEEKKDFVEKVCSRKFGIGADGVIFIQKSEIADIRFRYFNSDGGEAEMCGNGIRCFARLAFERGYVGSKFKVETKSGIKNLKIKGKNIRVDMGSVKFSPEDLPAIRAFEENGLWYNEFDGKRIYAVNTGVPHAVVFVSKEWHFDLDFAKKVRYSEFFPEGINVNFVYVSNDEEIIVRTYERGVEDETLSCGTGSVASACVAFKLGFVDKTVKVVTRGGESFVEFDEVEENGKKELRAYLIGPAVKVFEGIIKEI